MATYGRWQGTVTDEYGNAIPNATVTVRNEDGGLTLANIYSDKTGATPLGNPIYTDADGFAGFYAIGGQYRIEAVKGTFTRTWPDVSVAQFDPVRQRLLANTTFYVRTDGSNSNDGLANTSGGAFLTLQYAYDYIAARYDLAGYTATIKLAAGTYAGGLAATTPITGGALVIEGDNATPANVIIAGGANCAFRADNVQFSIKGFKVTSTSQDGVSAIGLGKIDVIGNMEYGACTGAHLTAVMGGFIHISANYSYSGATAYHMLATSNGCIRNDAAIVTASGNPAISGATAGANTEGVLMLAGPTGTGCGWTGTVSNTVLKFVLASLGVIYTNNLGVSHLPGAGAGTMAGGARYDNVDYASTSTSLLKGNGSGGIAQATAGTDYAVPSLAQTWTKPQLASMQALTHNTAWDGTDKQHLTVTVNGSGFTIANPSAVTSGVYYSVFVTYSSTHSISWGSNFKGVSGVTPTATAGAFDHFVFRYNGTYLMLVGYALNCGA